MVTNKSGSTVKDEKEEEVSSTCSDSNRQPPEAPGGSRCNEASSSNIESDSTAADNSESPEENKAISCPLSPDTSNAGLNEEDGQQQEINDIDTSGPQNAEETVSETSTSQRCSTQDRTNQEQNRNSNDSEEVLTSTTEEDAKLENLETQESENRESSHALAPVENIDNVCFSNSEDSSDHEKDLMQGESSQGPVKEERPDSTTVETTEFSAPLGRTDEREASTVSTTAEARNRPHPQQTGNKQLPESAGTGIVSGDANTEKFKLPHLTNKTVASKVQSAENVSTSSPSNVASKQKMPEFLPSNIIEDINLPSTSGMQEGRQTSKTMEKDSKIISKDKDTVGSEPNKSSSESQLQPVADDTSSSSRGKQDTSKPNKNSDIDLDASSKIVLIDSVSEQAEEPGTSRLKETIKPEKDACESVTAAHSSRSSEEESEGKPGISDDSSEESNVSSSGFKVSNSQTGIKNLKGNSFSERKGICAQSKSATGAVKTSVCSKNLDGDLGVVTSSAVKQNTNLSASQKLASNVTSSSAQAKNIQPGTSKQSSSSEMTPRTVKSVHSGVSSSAEARNVPSSEESMNITSSSIQRSTATASISGRTTESTTPPRPRNSGDSSVSLTKATKEVSSTSNTDKENENQKGRNAESKSGDKEIGTVTSSTEKQCLKTANVKSVTSLKADSDVSCSSGVKVTSSPGRTTAASARSCIGVTTSSSSGIVKTSPKSSGEAKSTSPGNSDKVQTEAPVSSSGMKISPPSKHSGELKSTTSATKPVSGTIAEGTKSSSAQKTAVTSMSTGGIKTNTVTTSSGARTTTTSSGSGSVRTTAGLTSSTGVKTTSTAGNSSGARTTVGPGSSSGVRISSAVGSSVGVRGNTPSASLGGVKSVASSFSGVKSTSGTGSSTGVKSGSGLRTSTSSVSSSGVKAISGTGSSSAVKTNSGILSGARTTTTSVTSSGIKTTSTSGISSVTRTSTVSVSSSVVRSSTAVGSSGGAKTSAASASSGGAKGASIAANSSTAKAPTSSVSSSVVKSSSSAQKTTITTVPITSLGVKTTETPGNSSGGKTASAGGVSMVDSSRGKPVTSVGSSGGVKGSASVGSSTEMKTSAARGDSGGAKPVAVGSSNVMKTIVPGGSSDGPKTPAFGGSSDKGKTQSSGAKPPVLGGSPGGSKMPAIRGTSGAAKIPPVGGSSSGARTPGPGGNSGGEKTAGLGGSSGVAKSTGFVASSGGVKGPVPGQASGGAKPPVPGGISGGAKVSGLAGTAGGIKTPATGGTVGGVKTAVCGGSSGGLKTPASGGSSSGAKPLVPGGNSSGVKSPCLGVSSGGAKTPGPGESSSPAKISGHGESSGAARTPAPRESSGRAKMPTSGESSSAVKTPGTEASSSTAKPPGPGEHSVVAKTPCPAESSGRAKMPTSGESSSAVKTPGPEASSSTAKTPGPEASSSAAKTPDPGEHSVVAKTPCPAESSAAAKTHGPGESSSAARTPGPGERSDAAKTPSSGESSAAVKTPGSAESSDAAKTPSSGECSAAVKTPGPGESSDAAKPPSSGESSAAVKIHGSEESSAAVKIHGSEESSGAAKTTGPGESSGKDKTPGTADSSGASKTPGPGESSGATKTCGPGESSGAAKTPGPGESSGATKTCGSGESSGAAKTHDPGESSGAAKTRGPGESSDAAKTPGPGESTGAAKTPVPRESSGGARAPGPGDSSGAAKTPGPRESGGGAKISTSGEKPNAVKTVPAKCSNELKTAAEGSSAGLKIPAPGESSDTVKTASGIKTPIVEGNLGAAKATPVTSSSVQMKTSTSSIVVKSTSESFAKLQTCTATVGASGIKKTVKDSSDEGSVSSSEEKTSADTAKATDVKATTNAVVSSDGVCTTLVTEKTSDVNSSKPLSEGSKNSTEGLKDVESKHAKFESNASEADATSFEVNRQEKVSTAEKSESLNTREMKKETPKDSSTEQKSVTSSAVRHTALGQGEETGEKKGKDKEERRSPKPSRSSDAAGICPLQTSVAANQDATMPICNEDPRGVVSSSEAEKRASTQGGNTVKIFSGDQEEAKSVRNSEPQGVCENKALQVKNVSPVKKLSVTDAEDANSEDAKQKIEVKPVKSDEVRSTEASKSSTVSLPIPATAPCSDDRNKEEEFGISNIQNLKREAAVSQVSVEKKVEEKAASSKATQSVASIKVTTAPSKSKEVTSGESSVVDIARGDPKGDDENHDRKGDKQSDKMDKPKMSVNVDDSARGIKDVKDILQGLLSSAKKDATSVPIEDGKQQTVVAKSEQHVPPSSEMAHESKPKLAGDKIDDASENKTKEKLQTEQSLAKLEVKVDAKVPIPDKGKNQETESSTKSGHVQSTLKSGSSLVPLVLQRENQKQDESGKESQKTESDVKAKKESEEICKPKEKSEVCKGAAGTESQGKITPATLEGGAKSIADNTEHMRVSEQEKDASLMKSKKEDGVKKPPEMVSSNAEGEVQSCQVVCEVEKLDEDVGAVLKSTIEQACVGVDSERRSSEIKTSNTVDARTTVKEPSDELKKDGETVTSATETSVPESKEVLICSAVKEVQSIKGTLSAAEEEQETTVKIDAPKDQAACETTGTNENKSSLKDVCDEENKQSTKLIISKLKSIRLPAKRSRDAASLEEDVHAQSVPKAARIEPSPEQLSAEVLSESATVDYDELIKVKPVSEISFETSGLGLLEIETEEDSEMKKGDETPSEDGTTGRKRRKRVTPEILRPKRPRKAKEKIEGEKKPKKPRKKRGKKGAQSVAAGTEKDETASSVSNGVMTLEDVKPTVQIFEEETRMSADSNSRSQTPARSLPLVVPMEDESLGSVISNGTTESTKKKARMEVFDPDSNVEVTAENLIEYQWPLNDKGAEHYMIQEQISEFVGVKSFRRRYPDLKRRPLEPMEKEYLQERNLVSNTLFDLGLTVLLSNEVLDIMFADFPEKFEDYQRVLRERQAKELKQKVIPVEKNKMVEYKEKAIRSAAAWNFGFNKERKDERRCCFDLQNFAIHYPKARTQKMTREIAKVGHYPIALIPGQYTDFYKRYTPAELKYFPLNTVLYGPVRSKNLEDPGSDISDSDSDESSSSESSSSSSSEASQDSEESKPVPEAEPEETPSITCKSCSGGPNHNKQGQPEVLIQCGQCGSHGHPSCLDLTLDMVPHIKLYDWQCTDCKTCIECKEPADEDKMLFCDMCDRGYHIYCVGLRRVPSGRWHCQECAVCGSCGSKQPGGSEGDQNAQWQHEYKKGDKGTRVYAQTLCVPCSKLWRKGKYCQMCWRCYHKPEEEEMVNCSACDRWIHAGCCSSGSNEIEKLVNFICETCQEKSQVRSPVLFKTVKPTKL